MNLLFNHLIFVSILRSFLTETITSNNDMKMIVDVVNSYHKPTSIALKVCWKRTTKRDFFSMLEKTPRTVQFIDSVLNLEEIIAKNHLLIVVDISCYKSMDFLEEGNKLNMFRAPLRWLIYTNCKRNNSALDIEKYNMLINSEVILSEQKNKDYIMRIPYKVHAKTREVIWENFGKWIPGKGLTKHTNMIKSSSTRRKNLKGIPIVASFVIVNNSSKAEFNNLKNSHIDAISKTGYRQISHLYYFINATRVNIYSDTWGYLINGTWNGMIGSIVREEAELTGTITFLTTQRQQVLDFLTYPSPIAAKFVFREPSLSYQNNLFLLPFTPVVWICILALTFLLTVIIFITAKWEKESVLTKSSDETVLKPNISDIAIMIVGAISQQGSSTELKGSLGRLVMFILFMTFVFLYMSYSANIIVLLQSTSSQIKTLTDLYNSKLELGSEDTPYNQHLFSTATEPVRKAIYQNKIAPRGSKSNFMSLEEGVKKLQTKPFAFNMNLGTGYREIEKQFYEHEKCNLQEIEYIQENNPWVACRKNSPYREIYKIGLIRTQEHGLNDRENRLVYAKKPICSVHGGSFLSVKMMDFYPLLLMLAYGILVSCILLLLEIFYKERSRLTRMQMSL